MDDRAPGFRLRCARADDAEPIAAVYAPIVRDTTISFETEPPDAAEMQRRVTANLATHPWLVAETAEGFLGYAYASPHRARAAYRWSTEVSVYLADAARRRGAGRALFVALLAILAAQGFHRALAGIALPNAASAAFHEALGFRFLGTFEAVGFKHGDWRDVGWWQRPLSEALGASPPTPLAFAEWRTSEDGRRTLETLGVGD